LGTLNENSKHAWWGGGAARGTRAGDDNAAAGRDRDGGEARVPASLGREFSTRGAGRAPSRVPRHTITSSNFLVVGDPARKNRSELESALPVLDPRDELARSTTPAGRPGRAGRATGRGSRTHLPRAVSCRTRRDFRARVFGRAHRRGSETLSIGVRRERLVDSPEAPSPGASPWVASWTPRSQLTPPRASIGSPSLSV
jgi:hypothetical protein